MFATPAAVLGMWFRGLLAIAILALAGWLVWSWYDSLPGQVRDSEPTPNRDSEVRSLTVRERLASWRPGFDRPTAMLCGGALLLLLSFSGSVINRRLLLPVDKEGQPDLGPGKVQQLTRPDGTILHVETHGPDGAPTVVLTHGWGMDSREWSYLHRRCGSQFRMVTWDLVGLGKSSRAANRDYSLDRMADDLKAVIEASGAQRLVLVGHSIGGMIILTLAKRYPALLGPNVSKLVIIHSSYTNPLRTMRFGKLVSALQKPLVEPLLHLQIAISPIVWAMNWLSYLNGSAHNSVARSGFAGTESREKLDFVAGFTPLASPAVLARGALGMCRYDATDVLNSIPIPVLVFAGDRDPVTSPDASQTIASQIPKTRLHTLSPGKHYGFIEHDTEFARSTAAFCSA